VLEYRLFIVEKVIIVRDYKGIEKLIIMRGKWWGSRINHQQKIL
jgi:hypothetical protein